MPRGHLQTYKIVRQMSAVLNTFKQSTLKIVMYTV